VKGDSTMALSLAVGNGFPGGMSETKASPGRPRTDRRGEGDFRCAAACLNLDAPMGSAAPPRDWKLPRAAGDALFDFRAAR